MFFPAHGACKAWFPPALGYPPLPCWRWRWACCRCMRRCCSSLPPGSVWTIRSKRAASLHAASCCSHLPRRLCLPWRNALAQQRFRSTSRRLRRHPGNEAQLRRSRALLRTPRHSPAPPNRPPARWRRTSPQARPKPRSPPRQRRRQAAHRPRRHPPSRLQQRLRKQTRQPWRPTVQRTPWRHQHPVAATANPCKNLPPC